MLHVLDEVGRITDAELVCRLESLVRADRASSVKLLVHRFPLVLERLADGAVHLTAIRLLAPLLTAENHVQLLDRVRGMTKRQIEVMIADLAPKPDALARVRKLPEPRGLFESKTAAVNSECCSAAPKSAESNTAAPSAASPLAAVVDSTAAQPTAAPSAPASTFALQSPRARGTSTPLGGGRFKLRVTLGQEAQDALDQLVELFRHQNPSGDLTSIVERALVELRNTKMKQRFAQTPAPKQRCASKIAVAKPDVEPKTERKVSRHIPAAVRRVVHARDNGQCTFVSSDGRRCTERGFMEVHHHNTTFARGGEATAENLRLACRAHNQFLAEKDYGRAFMEQKLREARARNSAASSTRQFTIPGANHL